jgi:hypothetical protein
VLLVALLTQPYIVVIPLKYSKCKSEENPSKSDVGLSSNSWHADEFMAVGAILPGQ